MVYHQLVEALPEGRQKVWTEGFQTQAAEEIRLPVEGILQPVDVEILQPVAEIRQHPVMVAEILPHLHPVEETLQRPAMVVGILQPPALVAEILQLLAYPAEEVLQLLPVDTEILHPISIADLQDLAVSAGKILIYLTWTTTNYANLVSEDLPNQTVS